MITLPLHLVSRYRTSAPSPYLCSFSSCWRSVRFRRGCALDQLSCRDHAPGPSLFHGLSSSPSCVYLFLLKKKKKQFTLKFHSETDLPVVHYSSDDLD